MGLTRSVASSASFFALRVFYNTNPHIHRRRRGKLSRAEHAIRPQNLTAVVNVVAELPGKRLQIHAIVPGVSRGMDSFWARTRGSCVNRPYALRYTRESTVTHVRDARACIVYGREKRAFLFGNYVYSRHV